MRARETKAVFGEYQDHAHRAHRAHDTNNNPASAL
jgi:hypothetical protein